MRIYGAKFSTVFFRLLISGVSYAQDFRVADLFLSYSLLHGDLQKHASGWEVSGGPYLKQWLSLHADFDAHHQSSADSQRHQHDFMFGPEFSYRTNHFTLFGHSFSGVTHVSGNLGKETGFGTVAGGGIDWDVRPGLGFRLIQLDYHTTYLLQAFQNDARFSIGVVFHLGGFGDPVRPAPRPPDQKPPETSSIH